MTDRTQRNRELARRWFEEGWNQKRVATVDELMGVGAVGHLEGQGATDVEQFKAFRAALLGAFSDLEVCVDDIVADGDHVVVRWRLCGTHDGNGLGIPATQRSIEYPGMTWLTFRDGRIVKGYDAWNQAEFMKELQGPMAELPVPDNEAIRRLVEERWPQAVKARAWKDLGELCTEDVVYLPQDLELASRRDGFVAVFKNIPPVETFEQSCAKVIGNGDLALAYGTFEISLKEGDGSRRRGKYLANLERHDGTWLVKAAGFNWDAIHPDYAAQASGASDG